MAKPGSRTLGTLVIAILIAAASIWLVYNANAVFCEHLPAMTILATLAAFVMALCFRLLARANTRPQTIQLIATLIIAGLTLFCNARFVLKYRGFCTDLEKQIQQFEKPAK